MEPLKILILDDEETRHRRFRAWLGVEHYLTHVYDVDEFDTTITKDVFDVVFLDHDIFIPMTTPTSSVIMQANVSSRDGRDAVKTLCALPESYRPKLVVVHSMNEPASQQMMLMLKDAGFNAVRKMFNPADPFKIRVQ